MRKHQDQHPAPRQPLFESFEPRQHLAATPAPSSLPDLKVELIYNPPMYVPAGGAVKAQLKVTNLGKSMPKELKFPLNYYISTSPKFPADAKPYSQTGSEGVKLNRNASKTYNITTRLPNDVTADRYFLFVTLNYNGKVMDEKSLANNIDVSGPLNTPVGTYSGRFNGDDNQKGTLTLKLSNSDAGGGLLADVSLRTGGATIEVDAMRAGLRRNGGLKITGRGSYTHPTLGLLTYRIDLDGKIQGDTYTGDARISWRTATDSRNSWDQSITLKRA